VQPLLRNRPFEGDPGFGGEAPSPCGLAPVVFALLALQALARFESCDVQPVSGLRSGAAVRKDAELVSLWVGKHDPALIALADVGVPGT
jgi:hypothetical protein